MGELAKMIISIINPVAQIVTDEQRLRPEKSEVNRLLGANSLIKELTEWSPRYDLKSGLQETINWFQSDGNASNYKSDIYNV